MYSLGMKSKGGGSHGGNGPHHNNLVITNEGIGSENRARLRRDSSMEDLVNALEMTENLSSDVVHPLSPPVHIYIYICIYISSLYHCVYRVYASLQYLYDYAYIQFFMPYVCIFINYIECLSNRRK